MNQNLVNVCGCPHPFRTTRIDDAVEAGGTLEQIITRGLDRMNVPEYLRDCGHAYVGAKYIPREAWGTTIPLPGDFVTYRIIPQKSDGKNPLRTLLTLAVIVVAAFVSFGVSNMAIFTTGALAGFGGVAGAVAAGAVTAAGMLAVNALVPVKPPSLPSANSEADSQTYSVAGARNTLSPFGTVPVLLGRHRITPPQGARPYTEIVGNDQYVRQLFIMGYSDIALVSPLRIGDTPLSYYKEVQWEFIPETAIAAPFTRPKYYSSDVNEETLSIQLKEASSWQIRTTHQACDRFSLDITFPRGLVEFEDDGDKISRTVVVDAQYRKQGDSTWIDITGTNTIPEEEFKVPVSRRREYDSDYEGYAYVSEPKPYILCCSQSGDVELRDGSVVPSGYIGIFSFTAYGSELIDVVSITPPGSSGFSLAKTDSGLSYIKVLLGSGSLPMSNLVVTGKQTTALRRAFAVTPGGASAFYEVRLRRTTADSTEDQVVDETWWGSLRAISLVSPIKFPKPLAAISLRIKATGQLNGVIEELNVDAVTVCKDWDYKTSTWVERATENPASLFRHVLQHPANARRLSDSQIDLVQLQKWHDFCRTKGFSYSRYHDFADGIYAVLQDIAAAGRASVSRPDGLWSVVIDEPRTKVAQHFTPANSWGFNSTKALPRLPHGWRVRFINEEAGYQSDERIVYDDAHNVTNATEFEGLELPGVTDPKQVWKLARYHYACAKLRPEEYEFFADMEHIVCTRGDLIRVAHDVPLWGIAQGRVKSVAGQVVTVDNPCQMLSGKNYTVRFRLQTGATLVRSVVCIEGSNHSITLEGAGSVPTPGDLFMFGELALESSDLIVKHIEPSANFSARIVALDYSPEVFSADSGTIPDFQTSITKPYNTAIPKPGKPTVGVIRSDEGVLVRNPDGSLTSRIQIAFNLSSSYDTGEYWVQLHYRELGAETWEVAPPVRTDSPHVYISPAIDKQTYEFRLRTVKNTGVASDWTNTYTHTAVGKTTRPPAPLVMSATAAKTGVLLDWDSVPVLDLSHYVVRKGETWGTGTRIYQGKASAYLHGFLPAGTHKFWVKAVDVVGNNSLAATGATLVVTAPGGVGVTYGNEADYIRLHWGEPTSMFPIVNYDVRIGDTWATSTRLAVVKSTEHKVIGPAVGDYRFWVAAIDAAGNAGATDSVEVSVTACSAVSISAQIIDNNVLLSWNQATGGTFPPKEYEVRKGSTWDDAEVIGTVSARFSAIFETKSGTYTYWVAAVDRAGNVGEPASRVATVNEPPDYVLRSDIDSTFTGAKTNAFLEGGQLYAPVNTTETWTEHFTSNSWATPQDQINAGFDDYVEPTPTSARYVEDFDYGGVLSGTRITVTPNWVNVRGSSTLSCQIFTKKLVGDSWTAQAAGFSVFATAFQYVRVQIDVTPNGGQNDLVRISKINVNLSLKTKSDGGKVSCAAGDVGGTVVLFNVSFVDIHSLTVTPKVGGTAVYGLYDFDDAPNPTSFKILLYNAAGTRVSGEASWSAKGA